MAGEPYLLTLTESAGELVFETYHLIEAKDRQMVKYHFHRTLKDWGYTDTQWKKHCLESWDRGAMAEIASIHKLKPEEYEILDKFLYHWTKL
jgi:hypothetical protein